MSKTLYVGNLAYATTSDDLQNLFAQYGAIEKAEVIAFPDTGKSRGFGFVTITDDAGALKAIEETDGTELGGRNIRVREALPRAPRGDNPSFGGSRGASGGRFKSGFGGSRGGNRDGFSRGDRAPRSDFRRDN